MAGGVVQPGLRLRLPLTPQEVASMAPGKRRMKPYCNSSRPGWISTIATSSPRPPWQTPIAAEAQALDALTPLGLGTLYAFQREGTSPCHPH